MDDSALLANYVRTGSQADFAILVNRHANWVYTVCRRHAGENLADDVTQAVFATLARKAARLHPGTSIAGWLFKTARYASATARKIERRRREHERRAAAMNPTQTPDPASQGWQQILPYVDDAVARLRERDRRTILLRFYQGLSHQDIGALLGISAGAAERRLSRAIEKLRARLKNIRLVLTPRAFEHALQNQLITTAPAHVVSVSISVAAAGPSAQAALIMKGALAMKRLYAIKLAGIAAFLLTPAGIGLWYAVAAPTVPPATTPATLPSPAQSVIDLSTPRAAVASLSRAIKSGDRRLVTDCLTADPGRGSTAMDAALGWSIAEWQLVHAAETALPDAGPQVHARTSTLTLDFLLDMALAATPDLPDNLRIADNSAVLLTRIPPDVTRRLPAIAPPQVAAVFEAWASAPIALAKIDNQWKVDLDGSFRVQVSLHVPADRLEKQAHDLLEDMRRDLEQNARDFENHQFATPQDGYQQLMANLGKLPTKYPGFENSYSIQILPASQSAARLIGRWAGSTHIVVNWTQARELAVQLDIHADGSVTGKVGDATLKNGVLGTTHPLGLVFGVPESSRGTPPDLLGAGDHFQVTAALDGPLIAAEQVNRNGVIIVFRLIQDQTLRGGLASTGGEFGGGKDSMKLTAQQLVLQRQQ